MAGLIRGLGNINSYLEEQERRKEAAQASKAEWFKLVDGQHARVRFLQELDEASPNFSEKNDLGLFALEHQGPGPEGFKRKALCTAETGEPGECYGCDEHRRLNREDRENYKGSWKVKRRLYINALVQYYDKKTGEYSEPQVVVFAQGDSPKQVVTDLLGYATDDHTITNREWKISRKGAGLSDTSYSLKAEDKDTEKFDVEAYDLFDLDKLVRKVPYEEQATFYGAVTRPSESRDDTPPAHAGAGVGGGLADERW